MSVMNDSQDDIEASESVKVDESLCLSMIIILYKNRPLSRIQALLFDFRSESFLCTRPHGSSMSMIKIAIAVCSSK